jgi:hypothetical protein
VIRSQPQANSLRPYRKKKPSQKSDGGVAQGEALSSNPSTGGGGGKLVLEKNPLHELYNFTTGIHVYTCISHV